MEGGSSNGLTWINIVLLLGITASELLIPEPQSRSQYVA